MTKLRPLLLIGAALSIASCSQSDLDRAQSHARETKQQMKNDLDEANRKLKEGVQKADQETRRVFETTRAQLRQGVERTKQDLRKARDEIRDSRQQ